MNKFSSTRIGNIRLDAVTLHDVLAICAASLENHTPRTLLYANAHAVTLAIENADFARSLDAADILFCDGYGVYCAAQVLGHPLPERFTPPDWIDELAQLCISHNNSIFFLGGQSGVTQQAADRLIKRHPSLHIATHHGYFNKEGAESEAVVDTVNQSHAGVLLVGFGMPMQEFWIMRYRARIKAPIVMSVGALFDYLGGTRQRAPAWMTNHGLEWLGRLVEEPGRMWRRYLVGLPRFGLIICRQLLLAKRTHSTFP